MTFLSTRNFCYTTKQIQPNEVFQNAEKYELSCALKIFQMLL